MKDWEVVPICCGNCDDRTVGNYVISASYESVIGEALIDLTEGVERLSAGPDHLKAKT